MGAERDGKIIDWKDDLTADCPRKKAANYSDPVRRPLPRPFESAIERSMKQLSRGSNLVDQIRHHLAISAVTPSAGRRMMREGDIKRVRVFLDKLDITQFNRPNRFPISLDRATKSLARRIPLRWGAARKFLNIYLRNITYNFYLRRKYRLHRIEALLELPLDSYAADGLRADHEGNSLPRWKGVIHLTREANALYQDVARQVAKGESICRVHLDMKYWRAKPQARKKLQRHR
jgi:hypothetical protein